MNSDSTNLHDISVKTLQNDIIKLGDLLSGKPLYLKFWASWCQPCREQLPHLQETYKQYSKQLDIVAINLGINEDIETITDLQKQYSLQAPVVIDHTAILADIYDLRLTPLHILIDKEGNVVFKGHDVSDELNRTLDQLAIGDDTHLKPLKHYSNKKKAVADSSSDAETKVMLFSSSWCDWYLEKQRPQMASNCVKAQHTVNDLYKRYPDLNWSGIVTRLWTGDKELNEYKDKFNIKYPVVIDADNRLFQQYQVNNFPTLLAIKDGKEIFRLEDFSTTHDIANVFDELYAQ